MCGFIGPHIVDKLLADESDIRVIGTCTTGRLFNLERQKDNSSLNESKEN